MASSTQTFAKILELMEIAPTYFPELKPKFLPITRQVRNAIAQNDATDAARAGMVLGAVFTKHEKQLASIVANAKKKENGIAQDELIREAVKSRMRQNRCESVTRAGQWVAQQHKDENGRPEPGWSWGKIKLAIRGMTK